MAVTKYGNKPCEVAGEKYRSQKEMRRHQELLLQQRAGVISGLVREFPFVLAPPVEIRGRRRPSLRYIADFVYSKVESGQVVVEDAKGVRTTAYNIKRHLMKSVHGVDIVET